jgi:hypothetical protein
MHGKIAPNDGEPQKSKILEFEFKFEDKPWWAVLDEFLTLQGQ